MAMLGNIEQFNANDPTGWESYQERIEFFLAANGITDVNKKKTVFLSVCGSSTYEILRSLIAPTKVINKSYEEIVTVLQQHFTPRTSEIVYRFRFYRRDQQPGETFSVYLKELRHLAEKCGFENLENMLRDRIVCGVRDENLQRRLLAEDKITFQKTQNLCLAHEGAAHSLAAIRETSNSYNSVATSSTASVNKVGNSHNNKQSRGSGSRSSAVNFAGRKNKCFRCDAEHSPDTCGFKNVKCRFCNKEGHIEKACFSKKRQIPRKNVHNIDGQSSSDDEVNNIHNQMDFSMNKIQTDKITGKILINVRINEKNESMEVDSGAAFTVMGKSTFQNIFCNNPPVIRFSNKILRDYQHKIISIIGECDVLVKYGSKSAILPLIIVDADRASLLGRNWFSELGLSITGVSQISNFTNYIKEYPEVFNENLGQYKGPPVTFDLDSTVKPITLKARNIPFALKDKVDKELERLIEQGVLEPVTYPKWCTPIVVVPKNKDEVRICGDYRSTINKALRADTYPVPCVQNILSALKGGTVFAKLDMAQAYLQLAVDHTAAEAQTIITHKGAFLCKRLQFGVSVAPQIFQRFIDTRLSGIQGILPYYDDILIVGVSDTDLEQKVRAVLSRFREDGLHLRKDKCVFKADKITFLGFEISAEGIKPTKDKVSAIVNAPAPTNKTELQAFLGLLNFYHIFLKDKASIAEPLHKLLHKNVAFQWRAEQSRAFVKLKNIIATEPILGHYDEGKPLILTCDASPYGVGCVLAQLDEYGVETPVAFHSRTLSSSERNFAQIDREALAVIVGIKKFHTYAYGRHVLIKTDHKPLLGIFGSNKSIPEILSPRMLRWTLLLSAYDYNIQYVPGKQIGNADALSRLPLKVNAPEAPLLDDVLMLENIPEKILCAKEVAAETKKDPVLSKVLQMAWKGWPKNNEGFPVEISPYLQRKNEISCYQDCLLWGTRVIIPPGGRKRILEILHSAHPGIVKMKGLARSYVWWPNLDKEIEDCVNSCHECQEARKMPNKAPLHPWEWSRAPWTRLHVDFAGPTDGKYFLIVIDSFSKWLEVRQVPTTSSIVTIMVLRELFATHGIPDVCVSDNGSCFTSLEFKEFLKNNGIRQALVAPYHPSSNGQAERMVQNVKNALKKMTGKDISLKLSRYLISQHISPHGMTGKSPAEILMGRKLNTLLDKVYPDFSKEMVAKQEKQLQNKPVRSFVEEDPVFCRSFVPGQKWLPSTIVEPTGPLSYRVATPDGKIVRRHTDQLRNRHTPSVQLDKPSVPEIEPNEEAESEVLNPSASMTPEVSPVIDPVDSIRRPARIRHPPRYLEDFIP